MIYLPYTYLFAHNCKATWRFYLSNLVFILVLIFISITVLLLNVSNRKYLRRSSHVKNLKYHTFVYLFVKHMCIFLIKFVQINLYCALNWWYLLDIRIIAIGSFAIHKGMLYSALSMLSLKKNTFLDVYPLILEREGLLVG